MVFDDATKIATVKINGKELQYGSSLGNAKIIDKKMIINANELYNSALTVNVSLNNKIFKIDLTRKEQVLELLKSFDVNARADGKNKNTINVYNYKTKTPVKYEYKRSIKIYDVLTKSGFIYAKTGSACYTEVSKNNYVATVKNIFEHHLDFSETEIYNRMKEFSIDDILFIDKINNLDSNFDGLQVLYIFKNYSENESTKLFLDMNFSSNLYVNFKKSYDSTHIGYISSGLYEIGNKLELEAFTKTRSELVELYIKNSCTLTIDGVLYGIGHALPQNQYQNLINVDVNGKNVTFDIMDINAVAKFIEMYDYGCMNLIPIGSYKIYAYNYKTKTTIEFSYTKQMKLEDLLKATGFVNAETGVACYTKTDYNSYKVTAVNSNLHKIGLTRQELVSFMKTLNGLDLMCLEDILKVIAHDDWTSEEVFIRYSTIMYLLKTKNTQITMGTGVVIDATNTFESSKWLAELGYPQDFTEYIGTSYRSSRVGTTLSELIAMDVIARGEEVRNAVDFAITYLFMRLNSNLRFGSDNAFVDVAETESPGIGGTGITTRIVDETLDSDILSKVNEKKKLLPSNLKKNPNTAYADTDIKGLSQNDFFAHSSIQNIDDLSDVVQERIGNISIKPINPEFETQVANKNNVINGIDGWDRWMG